MTAANRVFALPELLEQILFKLGPKDMLVAQRVATIFRDTTVNSGKLQRLLFLQQPIAPGSFFINLMLPQTFGVTYGDLLGFTVNVPNISNPSHTKITYIPMGPEIQLRVDTSMSLQFCDELKTSTASWLDMYLLKTDEPVKVVLHNDKVGCLEKNKKRWSRATVSVLPITMRHLLRVANCLKRAAEGFEACEKERTGEHTKLFMRKNSFEGDLLKFVIGEPALFIRW